MNGALEGQNRPINYELQSDERMLIINEILEQNFDNIPIDENYHDILHAKYFALSCSQIDNIINEVRELIIIMS